MDCGHSSCRHELQQRLAELNPHMADAVRHASSAAAAAGGSGISNRAAYERALRVGTAADARKVAAGEDAEQVRRMCRHVAWFKSGWGCRSRGLLMIGVERGADGLQHMNGAVTADKQLHHPLGFSCRCSVATAEGWHRLLDWRMHSY
jgi:hypothetical protein